MDGGRPVWRAGGRMAAQGGWAVGALVQQYPRADGGWTAVEQCSVGCG